jgi:5-methylcytosine-specific restriction endonuclease McrA
MATPRNDANRKRMRARIAATRAACHICGGAIDYTLSRDEPRSFVIDHVVPLHRGGADELSNVKAAHRACNSTKRARLVAPIVKRSRSLE